MTDLPPEAYRRGVLEKLRRIARGLGLDAPPDAVALLPTPPPAIIREHRENEEARQLRRLAVEAGPLAFVDHCEMLATERAFGDTDEIEEMSFETTTREDPIPARRARPGETPPVEKATRLHVERAGTLDAGDADGWREIEDDEDP